MVSFRIRSQIVVKQENQNKTHYKVNIDCTLHCCSPHMQFLPVHLYLSSTSYFHSSFACCRQFASMLIHFWQVSINLFLIHEKPGLHFIWHLFDIWSLILGVQFILGSVFLYLRFGFSFGLILRVWSVLGFLVGSGSG